MGSRDSSVVIALDSWLKGHGFESHLERWENFLVQGQFPCWLLFWYPFYAHATAVLRKRSQCNHSAQKCMWQVTAKCTCILHMWLCISAMKWCMVLWCTQNMLRWQQFCMVPAVEQPNSAVSTPLQWILKMCYKQLVTYLKSHATRV